MGLDLTFYKFNPQGTHGIHYMPWMGDLYTEIDISEYYDWEMFKELTGVDIQNDYNWDSITGSVDGDVTQFIGSDRENGCYHHYSHKVTKKRLAIEDHSIPCFARPYKTTFADEVFYVRKGYGGQMLGRREKGEPSLKKIWEQFKKDLSAWQPEDGVAPVIPKTLFGEILSKPEYKWLKRHILENYSGLYTTDYDVVNISW